MSYKPELGQALFSNSPWGKVETPPYVIAGIDLIAATISGGEYVRDPTNNIGCDGNFENDVFAMRGYCWCDGGLEGHEEGCPPNFQCGDFEARWYKHSHRGTSQNRPVTTEEWRAIVQRCLSSLESTASHETSHEGANDRM